MSLKTAITSRVTSYLTGNRRLQRRRRHFEQARQRRQEPHVIEVFHEIGDPYSALLAQVLGEFQQRYAVTIKPWLVAPPADWAAPERAQLTDYSRVDAERLARRFGLSFSDPGQQPAAQQIATAQQLLTAALANGTLLDRVAEVESALWAGQLPAGSPTPAALAVMNEGFARRESLGHYLGATLYYGGEWYWGIDRLHYLEQRLRSVGAERDSETGAEPLIAPPDTPSRRPSALVSGTAATTPIEFYLSFRSPYTYLATRRIKALADAYQAPLALKFVLPMIMRNLPVPRTKGLYILQDAAREAQRLDLPFGTIADPVGRPVERGYAILPWAVAQGRGYEFAESFMRGVWSEAIDAGSDAGLRWIVERADLDWATAKAQLTDDRWRTEAEANRLALAGLGIWGVPSFRYGDVASWGQDRLWVIEDAIQAGGAQRAPA